MNSPKSSKKPSKSVVERKKIARRVKYNTIGVAKQQAIIASANIISIDEEDVDMSDAFEFMTWYLTNIEQAANADGPVPESIVIKFRENLLTLDLTGNCLREKVEWVMDVVRAPELKEVCASLVNVDCDAVDALTEVPLIDLSDTACGIECGMLSTASVDHQPQSIGTTEPVREYTEYDENVSDLVEDHGTVPTSSQATEKDKFCEDVFNFIKLARQYDTCPILTFGESWKNHNKLLYGETGFEKSSHYVVTWSLQDFRRLFISDYDYDCWLYELRESRIMNNIHVRTQLGDTQHYFSQLFAKLVDLPVSLRYETVGFMMMSSGLTIITTGEKGCHFIGM